MKVEVEFFATLRLKLPKPVYVLDMPDGSTVKDLMYDLDRITGQSISEELFRGDEVIPGTVILLNGRNILHLNGTRTLLEEGKVAVFPPVAGG
jgi:molybdopterin synthase sulfur carrier subunit